MSAHAVEKLWIRAAAGAAMEPQDSLTLVTDQGIEGDHTYGRMRHVTLVFADDWKAAGDELGKDVDPAGRRANVFVTGGNGLDYVGKTMRLGEARLVIKGETAPCDIMEKAAEGLRDALRPDGRAGVWGRVIEGGVVRPGDVLEAIETTEAEA